MNPSEDTPTQSQPSERSRRLAPIAGYLVLPLLVFLFTSMPGINQLAPFIAIIIVASLVILKFIPNLPRALGILLWTLLVLFLVGATGWFFSPFFFALYLAAIALAFIYTPGVAVSFTLALIAMFAFSVGEVNTSYDFLTLVSLLSVIPIAIALRKMFLVVQQEQKGILILESDKESGITSLDNILNNQVNRIGVTLRQPITYLKQALAMLDEGKLTKEEQVDVIGRMRKSAEELFTLVKEFERGVTKNSFVGKKDESVKTIKL